MTFSLPDLGYSYDALEPHIDARTMEIHHSKHHQAYVDNTNNLFAQEPDYTPQDADTVLRHIELVPDAIRQGIINNLGGHVNHSFFWKLLTPGGSSEPVGTLKEKIISQYGDLDSFKAEFHKAALTRFGSGWAWLVTNEEGELFIDSSANQDAPIMQDLRPVIGLDVWEHAYYLNYQNVRPAYIEAFWNLVNWDVAEENYITQ